MRNRIKKTKIGSDSPVWCLKLDGNECRVRQLHSIFVVSFFIFLKNDSVSYRNHNYFSLKNVNFHINYRSVFMSAVSLTLSETKNTSLVYFTNIYILFILPLASPVIIRSNLTFDFYEKCSEINRYNTRRKKSQFTFVHRNQIIHFFQKH